MLAFPQDLPTQIGRYCVLRELGKGAMGRVLLCEDPILEREVAVKHLRTDLAIAPEQRAPLLERMRQEARASARVSHPNLVALHDMGEDSQVALFLVFEYIEGPTLKERLTRGRLTPNAAAKLARELGSGMRFAHQAGVLHRDIKPENVILSSSGAKLADFGIARIPDSTLTQGGSILGTPAYSAPEAIGDGKFSPASDQFSLAATLYEALSGRRAFPGDDAVAVATLIANTSPEPIAAGCGVTAAVDVVLMRALSKQPSARFADCEQFGETLAAALEPSARRQQVTLPNLRQARIEPTQGRSRVPLALAAALAGAAGMWVGVQWLDGGNVPATTSVVTDVPQEESAPVAWLAERPAKAVRPSAPGSSSTAKPRATATSKPSAAPGTAAEAPDSQAATAE